MLAFIAKQGYGESINEITVMALRLFMANELARMGFTVDVDEDGTLTTR